MADEPVESLGGLTPLEADDTPSMDRLAGMGRSGLLATVPPGFHPGSEIANMGVLGYDVRTSFEGRGVLEAASMGIDVPGTPWQTVMIKATHPDATDTAALINDLIIKSQKILAEHPVNLARARDGKDCANSIWPWSPGYRPSMEPMSTRFGIKNGAVISAVDLIFGIGVYAGLRPIHVEGATGLADTNYEGKARAAIDALRSGADFVFLHIEASDEAGHEGDIELKKRTIEYLDRRIVAPIMEAADTLDEPLSIAVLPDHPTPCRLRTHTSDAVPFIIYHPGETPDSVTSYSERAAADGLYGLMKSTDFIEEFLKV